MAANPFSGSLGKYGAPAVRPLPDFHRPTPVRPISFPRRPLPRVPRVYPVPRVRPRFPLFPGARPGRLPFGKRPPLVYPFPPGVRRAFPWIEAAYPFVAIGLWYLLQPGGYAVPDGWIKCWDFGGPKEKMSGPTLSWAETCSLTAGDVLLGGQVPSGDYGDEIHIPAHPWELAIWFGPSEASGTRMQYTEKWRYPDKPGMEPEQWWRFVPETWTVPEFIPLNPPWYIPWIGQPEPFPIPYPVYPGTPPMPSYDPEGDPHPFPLGRPEPNPNGDADDVVRPRPFDIPSINLPVDVDAPPAPPVPGIHVPEPPDPDEREGKKRIKGNKAAWWLARLAEKGINSFTETDDVVSAIYKALPWKLRRWRGRDGVWRDRDINTASRLARIHELFGDLNIGDAITNVIQNEASDEAWGKLGQMFKRRAQELGDAGLWAGFRGFQAGENNKKYVWDELYKRLAEEAAKKQGQRYYFTREYDPATKQWYKKRHVRPMTQIPWLRTQSQWSHAFTDGKGHYIGGSRYYYRKG